MDALSHLKLLCAQSLSRASEDLTRSSQIDQVCLELEARVKGAGSRKVPLDLQLEAVQRFWTSKRLSSPKDGRLVSFGICLPIAPKGQCLLEDRLRFAALLDGVNQWLELPRRYRRCYQGLLTNYFAYDFESSRAPASGRENWMKLRTYLEEHVSDIQDSSIHHNPSWVTRIGEDTRLLGESPCESYGADMLNGDNERVAGVRRDLGIDDSSWFVRELVMAQVAAAVRMADDQFIKLLPTVLDIVSRNNVLRDRGLTKLLDRYARIPATPFHRDLSNCAVEWWGNPWLASNSSRWGAVVPSARKMVADWLKNEFVEAFFTLLAEEGTGDRRRMEFWKRYLPAIDDMYFVLGADARESRGRDFIELLKKMEGRTMSLVGGVSSANAFVMTLGDLVVVEFSGTANALYGYDRRHPLPFPLEPGAQLGTAKDGANSLKNSSRRLWLKHGDGIHGVSRWEDRFEATLRQQFNIEPAPNSRLAQQSRVRDGRLPQERPRPPLPEPARTHRPATTLFSLARLSRLASDHGFEIEDNSARGGYLWIRTAVSPDVARVLTDWGFAFKVGKGWWK